MYNLAIRVVIFVEQKCTNSFEEKIARFKKFVHNKTSKVNLGNIDKAFVLFDLRDVSRFMKKKRRTLVMTIGSENSSFIMVLTVTVNDNKCSPLMIVRRKTVLKGRFPPRDRCQGQRERVDE